MTLTRTGRQAQLAVIAERFGANRAQEALQQLHARISPHLHDVLARFGFGLL